MRILNKNKWINGRFVAAGVFATFLEQAGPQDAKREGDGEKFRMSERQRVRGTAVASYFCESRGNLVSNTIMPPFIQKLLALDKPRFFIRENL